MDTFEWAAAILAVTICFGPGLAAVTTAWLFPWLKGSIARPRLWGWGELMLGLFFTMQLMDQTVVSTPPQRRRALLRRIGIRHRRPVSDDARPESGHTS
ncbi:hypothetical protein [Streptomyces sp. OK228]|uniref:hypothetical protein n=1 Tax=Streptomyces sp. OK228 TaxID=1882786 RepID=UPI00117C1FA6|nr:hypothetical protein [Streptomyces sp. OK228]